MAFVPRELAGVIKLVAREFPSLVLTGPRRSGKTTLLRRLFRRAGHILLEDPDMIARARADPRGLLESLRPPVILDEIQNVPELFGYVRTMIDRQPRRMGLWLFTGSQEAPLMRGVTESMAGRAAVLQLLPFSRRETTRVDILTGGFPEALAKPKTRDIWFASYLQTYLERDVRGIAGIRDLATFRRFLSLVAARHGQVLNRSDIAAPLGVSVPTISAWLEILEITGQVLIVPPYFENFGKRLLKSPKVYWLDSGLVCHLLGIRSPAELDRSPFLGALFEGFIASEIAKAQVNSGLRKEIYFFRDRQGLEVDFVVLRPGRGLWLIECKASRTVHPSEAAALLTVGKAARNTEKRMLVVHRKSRVPSPFRALAPGVEALDVDQFLEEFG